MTRYEQDARAILSALPDDYLTDDQTRDLTRNMGRALEKLDAERPDVYDQVNANITDPQALSSMIKNIEAEVTRNEIQGVAHGTPVFNIGNSPTSHGTAVDSFSERILRHDSLLERVFSIPDAPTPDPTSTTPPTSTTSAGPAADPAIATAAMIDLSAIGMGEIDLGSIGSTITSVFNDLVGGLTQMLNQVMSAFGMSDNVLSLSNNSNQLTLDAAAIAANETGNSPTSMSAVTENDSVTPLSDAGPQGQLANQDPAVIAQSTYNPLKLG